jgi:hypothetical protein
LDSLKPGARNAKLPQVTVAQINQILATKPEPLTLISIESREASALVIQIAQNGPYRTYATAQRQSVTFRDGMITSTRGIGGDLMSSDTSALRSLVTRKKNGTSPYIMRYLTGEDVTQELQYSCTITRNGTAPVNLGEVNTVAVQMTAQCDNGADGSFSNTYLVDGAGDVVGGRQWLGPYIGYVSSQKIRK